MKERIGTVRLCGIAVLLLTLNFSSSAVWSNSVTAAAPVQFAPGTRVVMFEPGAGQWLLTTFGQTKPVSEFTFNNQLYRVVDSDKATVVPNVDAARLAEADLPFDRTSHRPASGDVVQVLDKDMRFAAHALLSTVQPGTTVRFEGKAYSVGADHSLSDTVLLYSCPLRRIEITRSAMQHITDRHTIGGTKNAGAGIFSPSENIPALIMNAQLVAPVVEPNGYVKRVFDAGRIIGGEGPKGQTSTYFVIATQSGKLVTAYPVVR
jgi:hypothetical protein